MFNLFKDAARDKFRRNKGGFRTFGRKKASKVFRSPALNRIPMDEDERYKRFLREIGDAAIAKRCWELFKQYPKATLPELIVMEWLIRNNYKHKFQAPALGGRYSKGGAVLDFFVFLPQGGLCIMVQGDYWHGLPDVAERDRLIKIALRGILVMGVRVWKVVEVWETDLYAGRAERTMLMALAGLERR